ncbi:MAG: DapH/DapD/GlmU-related protein [Candidatus Thermoplasmatota archaeon]
MYNKNTAFKGEIKKFNISLKSILRIMALFVSPLVVFSISALPSILIVGSFLHFFKGIWLIELIILPFILFIAFFILVIWTPLFSGYFIKSFNIQYDEGVYKKSIEDKNTFKFALHFILYRPTINLMKALHIPPLYKKYMRLVGAKIGKNVFFASRLNIADPCVTEIGDNTLIGGGASILAHLGENDLIVKKVKIGKNCLVGGESYIMPGVTMEEGAILGGKSLATKNMTLKKEKMYGGVPAKEIKK